MITAWSPEIWVLPGKEMVRVLVSWGKRGSSRPPSTRHPEPGNGAQDLKGAVKVNIPSSFLFYMFICLFFIFTQGHFFISFREREKQRETEKQ